MLNSVFNETEKTFSSVVTLSAFTILVYWILWNVIKKSKKEIVHPLPPGPRGFPVLGYLPFLGTDLQKNFTELAAIYGPIYKLWLGTKLCVVISSQSLAKEVFRDQDTTFAHRDPTVVAKMASYGGNDIIWSSYGPRWKKLRKLFVRELLSNASLQAVAYLREEQVKRTFRNVYSKIGEPVDIGELSFVTNINTVMKMLWGGTLEEEDDKAGKEFRRLVSDLVVPLGATNISDVFPMLGVLDLQGIKAKAGKILLGFDDFLNPIIQRGRDLVEAEEAGREKNKEGKDFLKLLFELQQHGDAETSLSTMEIKGLLIDIVAAGTDTTATTVEWVIAELMQNPKVMQKVHQELDEAVGLNNSVEEYHLPQLCYLDAVIKETLRLHPALPLLVPHTASQTCTIGGYTIPKGTRVFVNVYAIQRDPNLWENPLEFNPGRFLNDNACSKFDYSGNNFQFIPFGSGRRVCAGLPLAEKMLKYQLASLLHSFEWKLPSETKLELSDKFGIVVRKLKPLVAIPTPRLSNLDIYC